MTASIPPRTPHSRQRRPIILVDIDGTLADVRHRLHYIRGHGRKDWGRFFQSMQSDPPITPAVDWIKSKATENDIVVITGRPEQYRGVTESWFAPGRACRIRGC
jgi:hypothetical protein